MLLSLVFYVVYYVLLFVFSFNFYNIFYVLSFQIQYAKTNIETATGKVTGSFGVVQDKMTSVWSQIVTEEDDVQDVPKVNFCFLVTKTIKQ